MFSSFGPPFVFQKFALRTLCLRHDSELRFLSSYHLRDLLELEHYFPNITYKLLDFTGVTFAAQENTQMFHLCMLCSIKACQYERDVFVFSYYDFQISICFNLMVL